MANEGKNILGPIFITKYAGRIDTCNSPSFFPIEICCSCMTIQPVRTTEIRNIRDVSVDVNTPIERYALPETSDDRAILIKAIGNQTTITIQWLMHPEENNIVRQTLNACDAETCNAQGGITGGDTTSTENQLKWWGNVFQSNSITDRYHLYLGDCTVNNLCMGSGAYPPVDKVDELFNQAFSKAYHKDGVIQNFRAVRTGDSPINYNAQITFYVGRAEASPNEDVTL